MANYINGKLYPNGNISIRNNKVYIDGVLQSGSELEEKTINIVIQGDCENLKIDSINSLKITGNCKNIETTNGSVTIEGSVTGDIKTTNGNVKCGSIGGNIKTVNGNVSKF